VADLKNQKNPFIIYVVSMFYDLPLLPSDKIQQAFEAILKIQVRLGLFEKFRKFNNYYNNFWINKVRNIFMSVYDW
jgi:hypothetical protein